MVFAATQKAVMQLVGHGSGRFAPKSHDSAEIADAVGQSVVLSGKVDQRKREQGLPAAPLSQHLVHHMAILLREEEELPLA